MSRLILSFLDDIAGPEFYGMAGSGNPVATIVAIAGIAAAVIIGIVIIVKHIKKAKKES